MQTKGEGCIPTSQLPCLKFQIPPIAFPERGVLDLLDDGLLWEPVLGALPCCLSPWLWREFGRTTSRLRHREGCTPSPRYHTTTGSLTIFLPFLAIWSGRRLNFISLSCSLRAFALPTWEDCKSQGQSCFLPP